MKQDWDPSKIADHVHNYLTSKQGEQEINVIITFDDKGVSNHPNHIAVHYGVLKVFGEQRYPIDVLSLTTVGFINKYMAYIDI